MQTLLPIAERLSHRLKGRGDKVAVAESSAGGLIAASLLAVPGASAYFLGGVVIYTVNARRAFGITDAAMKGLRSSSEPYAELLAATVRERHGATWGLAETGAAGPTGNRYGDASGHACIAVNGSGAGSGGVFRSVRTLETGSPDRQANMRIFAAAALTALLEAVEAADA
jgi:nicotinamide-nucleotide amidase